MRGQGDAPELPQCGEWVPIPCGRLAREPGGVVPARRILGSGVPPCGWRVRQQITDHKDRNMGREGERDRDREGGRWREGEGAVAETERSPLPLPEQTASTEARGSQAERSFHGREEDDSQCHHPQAGSARGL